MKPIKHPVANIFAQKAFEQSAQDRYDRSLFELDRAITEHREAMAALAREYAGEQSAPDRDEDCSDLG